MEHQNSNWKTNMVAQQNCWDRCKSQRSWALLASNCLSGQGKVMAGGSNSYYRLNCQQRTSSSWKRFQWSKNSSHSCQRISTLGSGFEQQSVHWEIELDEIPSINSTSLIQQSLHWTLSQNPFCSIWRSNKSIENWHFELGE